MTQRQALRRPGPDGHELDEADPRLEVLGQVGGLGLRGQLVGAGKLLPPFPIHTSRYPSMVVITIPTQSKSLMDSNESLKSMSVLPSVAFSCRNLDTKHPGLLMFDLIFLYHDQFLHAASHIFAAVTVPKAGKKYNRVRKLLSIFWGSNF